MKKTVSTFSYFISIFLAVGLISYGVNIYKTGVLRFQNYSLNVGEYAIYYSAFFILSGILIFFLIVATYKETKL